MKDIYLNNSVLAEHPKRNPVGGHALKEVSIDVVVRQEADRLMNQVKIVKAEIRKMCGNISKETPTYETVEYFALRVPPAHC